MSEPYEIKMPKHPCIGAWFYIRAYELGILLATCIDATSDERPRPKRMRVQEGPHKGKVLMPFEYQLLERWGTESL